MNFKKGDVIKATYLGYNSITASHRDYLIKGKVYTVANIPPKIKKKHPSSQLNEWNIFANGNSFYLTLEEVPDIAFCVAGFEKVDDFQEEAIKELKRGRNERREKITN